jgi:hypothetical protein
VISSVYFPHPLFRKTQTLVVHGTVSGLRRIVSPIVSGIEEVKTKDSDTTSVERKRE